MSKYLCAVAALTMTGSVAASAAPLGSPNAEPRIILAAGGCGFGFHPNPYGECVPNRRAFYGYGPGPVVVEPRLPPPCPRGYHRDPDPARRLCYPNF